MITKTRPEAERLCQEMHPQGALAELETSEEAVAMTIHLNKDYNKCKGLAPPGPWIGGIERSNQNIFEWSSANTTIGCTNWELGRPNSSTTGDGIALNCANYYSCYDATVDTTLPFICESPPRKPSDLTQTQEGCRFPFTIVADRYCYYLSGTNRLQRVHAQSYCKTLHPDGRLAEIETGEELVSLTLYFDDQDEERKCGTWGAHTWFDTANSTELPFVCEMPYQIKCPDNFIFIGSSCYLISESTTLRPTAIQRCQESNATLLELETSWEIRSITDYLLAKCPGSCTRHYYLGMDPDPVHRVFKWISTGRPVTFNNWISGYPNSYANGQIALLNGGYKCKYRL
ncbi:unnamed protein product [Cyprideis torosa]|uniref:Uncharacterized protein n=1 Tax=Cyprideis torosa TaxID=163714 RepID=A0A7R8WML4_9CRUS|nr:unnamed protein product [Cyprideis torosa]CAG0902981.1 unnamed protein product [Cyprideis torosa]